MPFKPSLVALPVDPTASPYLGFPLTEIVLEQDNGESAALPALPTPDARDKIVESVAGSDVRINRRKLTDLTLDIDYISATKKAQIEKLYHDGRSIYLSPNFGPDTMFSFPLQRGVGDFTGNRAVATVRYSINYEWDAVDKVFRTFDAHKPSIVLNGKWSRYFRAHSNLANYASKPHPDSTSTGWTQSGGSASMTINYSEHIKTPLLSNRSSSTAKGVTVVYCPQYSTTGTITHISSAGLSTTQSVACSLCIAWKGLITVILQDAGGGITYTGASYEGDGTFQLIRLSGANSNASNGAEIQISMTDTTSDDQVLLIGPVYIGNGGTNAPGRFPDWNYGTAQTDITSETDSVESIFCDLTVSFFFKWADNENGFIEIGGATTGIGVCKWANGSVVARVGGTNHTFPTVDIEFDLSVGDWVHCVVTFGNGVKLYINGKPHSYNGTFPTWSPVPLDESLTLGYDSGYCLDNSGMSHMRVDRREWSAVEVTDHYDTYFRDFGRGIIEPVYGKVMMIDDMAWTPRSGGENNQWLGRITLRELGAEADFAPMQRQEDM